MINVYLSNAEYILSYYCLATIQRMMAIYSGSITVTKRKINTTIDVLSSGNLFLNTYFKPIKGQLSISYIARIIN